MKANNYHDYDFLIIGSGIAGLSLALELSKVGKVAVLTKKKESDSNTNYAQGGIAAVTSADDSFESHIQDTLRVGHGLSKREVVEKIIRSGPENIRWLTELGIGFSLRKSPGANSEDFDLGKEGGHSRSRVLHIADYTGREIEHHLLMAIRNNSNITVFENHIAIDLLLGIHTIPPTVEGNDIRVCYGVYVLDSLGGKVKIFRAHKTILASGGAGRVYYHTTNPDIATGDGIAMAYRAGAKILNMEFVQFHPTSLYTAEDRTFLISESVRGEGGRLLTIDGERFMKRYHPEMMELAPRDVVARAIDAELKRTGDKFVYLDIRHLGSNYIQSRFPNIYQNCLKFGVDITSEPIPVVPAAHYFCGGVGINLNGETDIKNLFACGETSCSGMHGANRLASNSLLEAVSIARNTAEFIKRNYNNRGKELPEIRQWIDEGVFDHQEWVMISHDEWTIRRLMSDYVGIVRSNKRLKRAEERVAILARDIEEFYQQNPVRPDVIELRNLSTVAMLVIKSAMTRLESRGLHYMTDYPETDDVNFKKDTELRRTDFSKLWQ